MSTPPRAGSHFATSIAQYVIISKFDIVSSNIKGALNMAEPEPTSIDDEPTPPPPQNPDIARSGPPDEKGFDLSEERLQFD
jgi:hypothetical protein